MATTTAAKPKRFSFAGFFSKKPGDIASTTQPAPPPDTPKETKQQQRRAQKTQSLYIQSFRQHLSSSSSKRSSTQYDPSEVQQSNHKEIRNTIRRSLSAVLYATPQKQEQARDSSKDSAAATTTSSPGQLVPILVTEGLFDQHSGMIMSKEPEALPEEPNRPKRPVEYDNTLDILPNKDGTWLAVWQGYGYMLKEKDDRTDDELFEKDVWSTYRGLIHPLHLVQDGNEDRWQALTVAELSRYYDNYGSMLLRLREACMKRQQRQYLAMQDKASSAWIIPHQA